MSDRLQIHASFMQRFGAIFIDAGFLFFVYTPFHFYNIIESKSIYLMYFYQSIWLLYKPLSELFFGQTLGKAILRIQVKDNQYRKLGFLGAFSRNGLFMLQSGLGFYFYQKAFTSKGLLHIHDFRSFQMAFFETFPMYNMLFYFVLALIMLDAIYLMFFGGVKEKSLHDKWAKTVVIVSEKS